MAVSISSRLDHVYLYMAGATLLTTQSITNHTPTKLIQHLIPLFTDLCERLHAPDTPRPALHNYHACMLTIYPE